MDDILGYHIGRCRFCTKDHSDGRLWQLSSLDLQILVNDIQGVQLLTFVFVKTLALNIKNRIYINFYSLGGEKISGKLPLILLFNRKKRFQRLFILCIAKKPGKLCRILMPSGTDPAVQVFTETMVAVHEPAAEGDTVGLVVEFLRIDLIELVQFILFQYLRVQIGYAVDAVAVMNIHVGHMHQIFVINNSYRRIAVFLLHHSIQLPDNGHKLGNHLPEIIHGPFFQRLRQNGMIGISAGS